jgi:NAD(P)-dependent dehydrogenase (short-subunit alcohol dehydrogenase family)
VRRSTDAEALRATNLEPIMLDIANDAEIAMLVKRITDDPDRRPLRALVNNAGIQVNAPVEAMPLSESRRLFDVNLFGHVEMTQALLPTLIERRGTVVNVSSVGGKVAMAGYGSVPSSPSRLVKTGCVFSRIWLTLICSVDRAASCYETHPVRQGRSGRKMPGASPLSSR